MHDAPTTSPPPAGKLFTFRSGGWVLLLAAVLTLVAAGWAIYPVLKTKFRPAVGDGTHVDSYNFDLSTCLIPRDQIVAAGVAKDEVRPLKPDEVQTITSADIERIRQREHRNFLVDSDRVIGVVINGEARAYPLRVLLQHEICNDDVQGTPIAVTYSPLCDSAVVFDRRIDGQTRLFGNSGLLWNSGPLFYDRQDAPEKESLWSQLLAKAVAGPKAAKAITLTRVDHALTTWGTWRIAYPDSRILAGLPWLREKVYSSDPYSNYFASDVLKFPVNPLWQDPHAGHKMRIVATPATNGKWVVTPTDAAESADPGPGVHAFLFAWYAAHPDSDFSAIRAK